MCTHAYMHTTCILHAYIHTCIHTYMHTYMHTYIHIYIHISDREVSSFFLDSF